MKRLTGLIAIGLFTLLTACGGGGSGESPPPSPPAQAPDTVPNAFAFTAQADVERSAVITSNEITVAGIDANASVSITGGEYSIAGGAFASGAGTVSNNQTIRVRVTSSGSFSTTASAVLTIGGVSATFSVTTLAMDATPAAFEFPRSMNATRDGWVNSATATITDINTDVPVSIEDGEYSIDGGEFTSAAGTIASGQTIQVRVRAGSTYSKVTTARLTVGTVTQPFEVTSELPDYVPDRIAYDGEDIVYLLNNANRLVFRWSIAERRYLDAFALAAGAEVPTRMACVPAQHRLYLGYSSGAIRQFTVTDSSPTETLFVTAEGSIQSLGNAGNFLAAQVGSTYGGGRIYDINGTVTDTGGYYYGYSRETDWDATNSRLYYTRDGISPNDLHYDVVDQATGEVISTNETRYHGDYSILPPIRVSAGGQYVLLGSGDIYTVTDPEAWEGMDWVGSVAGQVADARWMSDGSLVTLSTASNQTTLHRLSSTNLSILEVRSFSGQALRVVGSDSAMVVIVADDGRVQFHDYVPDDDSDDDGVENTADAFPLDAAASVDTDRDGYPDAWNAGMDADDSTTGLALDAFPQDAACWLSAHGSGGVCNYGATIPNYVPDQIVHDGDVVYLLSSANRRVYRWSISDGAYLNPLVVGASHGFTTAAPTTIAYVGAQQRLYLGYSTGAIRYISVNGDSVVEQPFVNAAAGIIGLANAGNFLAVQTSGGYGSGYLYNANGVVTDQGGYYYGYSREATWDPVNSRLYFTRDGISPNDLHYEVINQTTGEITSGAETPYHGAYSIMSPIRVSVNGQFVLLGSGDIYRYQDLTWAGSLGGQLTDARWFANGSVATLSTTTNQTVLRRLSADNLGTLELVQFAGQALRVVGSDTAMVVLVLNGGTVQFHPYVPSDDSDGDGVENTQDAFPLDPAASVDTDGDGYPDAWNAGSTQDDSTTGLVLDAFPADAACWLDSHGSGGVCDYGATIPNYVPDEIDNNGDIVYLLSTANFRVYRWSMATGQYLNPYIVGIDQGFSTLAPIRMTYSAAHDRLYLGYSNGMVRFIDVGGGGVTEQSFFTGSQAVNSLGTAGNFLIAQAGAGYVLDAGGAITAQGGYYYGYSRYTAFDPVSSRLYFTRDGLSPNDLHYDVIDQSTGAVTASGETPYHGEYSFVKPIRVSADGGQVLLGSGNVFARNGLTWAGSLGKTVTDAQWMDGLILDVDSTDLVEIRDANSRLVLQTYQYLGTPLRVLKGQTETYLVHVTAGTTAFVRLPFYDADGDTIQRWWEQLHGLSDADPTDAALDPDGDGLDNAAEFAALTNPNLGDTDGDGLTDADEVNTHLTDPLRTDTDGDGLDDAAEVNTHLTDPLDTDSDNDGYSDFIEVRQGGDPNDVSSLPQPISNYSLTFEGTPDLSAWSMPSGTAPWSIDGTMAHAGSASLKSGAIANAEYSSVRWRGFFAAGQLRFWALVDTGYCCNRLRVLIDGNTVLDTYGTNAWEQRAVAVSLGLHDIEWRFERYSFGGEPTEAARIDDIVFTAQ